MNHPADQGALCSRGRDRSALPTPAASLRGSAAIWVCAGACLVAGFLVSSLLPGLEIAVTARWMSGVLAHPASL